MTAFEEGQWRWVMGNIDDFSRWHLTSDGARTFCKVPLRDSTERELGDFLPTDRHRCELCTRTAADWLGL